MLSSTGSGSFVSAVSDVKEQSHLDVLEEEPDESKENLSPPARRLTAKTPAKTSARVIAGMLLRRSIKSVKRQMDSTKVGSPARSKIVANVARATVKVGVDSTIFSS